MSIPTDPGLVKSRSAERGWQVEGLLKLCSFLQLCFKCSHFHCTQHLRAKQEIFRKNEETFQGAQMSSFSAWFFNDVIKSSVLSFSPWPHKYYWRAWSTRSQKTIARWKYNFSIRVLFCYDKNPVFNINDITVCLGQKLFDTRDYQSPSKYICSENSYCYQGNQIAKDNDTWHVKYTFWCKIIAIVLRLSLFDRRKDSLRMAVSSRFLYELNSFFQTR